MENCAMESPSNDIYEGNGMLMEQSVTTFIQATVIEYNFQLTIYAVHWEIYSIYTYDSHHCASDSASTEPYNLTQSRYRQYDD